MWSPATLRAIRKLRGYSQVGLAERVGLVDPEAQVSESLVALIETGRRQPSRRNAVAIAKALDVEFGALFQDRAVEVEAEEAS